QCREWIRERQREEWQSSDEQNHRHMSRHGHRRRAHRAEKRGNDEAMPAGTTGEERADEEQKHNQRERANHQQLTLGAVPVLQIRETDRAPFVERPGDKLPDPAERHQAWDSAAAEAPGVNRCSSILNSECSALTRPAAERADDRAESSADWFISAGRPYWASENASIDSRSSSADCCKRGSTGRRDNSPGVTELESVRALPRSV